MKKFLARICAVLVIVALAVPILSAANAEDDVRRRAYAEDSGPAILQDSDYIAHALGLASTQDRFAEPINCLEGFQTSYENGTRVFEADFRFTRDGHVILRHDWWHDLQDGIGWSKVPDLETFLSTKYHGGYTPLSFKDLLKLMDEHPDVALVTDTKFTDSDVFFLQFDAMMEDTKELGLEHVWDRIIVQCYSANMHTALSRAYPEIKHYIYTMYQDGWFDQKESTFEEKCKVWYDKGAIGITMDATVWHPEFKAISDKYDLMVFVHTVNDASKAAKYMEQGVDAIYTDYLHD